MFFLWKRHPLRNSRINIRGPHFAESFLSPSATTSVMTVSYVDAKICVSWFLLLVLWRTNQAVISGEETVWRVTNIHALVHGKVLFNFCLSSCGDFRAIVAVRRLFKVFHNGDHIPIQKNGCYHLKFSKFSHCNRNCLSDTVVFHIILERVPHNTLC